MATKERMLETDGLQRHIVLLAAVDGRPIEDSLRLQCMVFLAADMLDKVGEYGYVPGRLGPHSGRVDEALRNLERAGVLARGPCGIGIADGGRGMAGDLLEGEDGDMRATLGRYKRLFSGITREEMLSFVYSAYPDMVQRSAEYESLRPHMEEHIISLIEKEKISAQRAAELSHRTLHHIIGKMSERGMTFLAAP